MNQDDLHLSERLQAAFEVEMSDETRKRHLSVISAALKEQPSRVPTVHPLAAHWRRRFAAFVAAATIFSPAAVAVAAEGALPGDTLYPVKQMTEDLRSVIDPTIAARHRIDEADRMHEVGFPIDQLETVLTKADRAITDVGDPDDLRARFVEVRDNMNMDYMTASDRRDESVSTHTSDVTDMPEGDDRVDDRDAGMIDEMPEGATQMDHSGSRDSQDQDTMSNGDMGPDGDMDARDRATSDEDAMESDTSTTTVGATTSTTIAGATSPTTTMWGSGSESWANHDNGDTGYDPDPDSNWSP